MSETQRMQPYTAFRRWTVDEMRKRATAFCSHLQTRRTVREFSDEPVPDDVVNCCMQAAVTAPSGANLQPWTFVRVTRSELRAEIREAAEEEERAFYGHRAPESWLTALAPLGTDAQKPFLETAPLLIAVFAHAWDRDEQQEKRKNYYVSESVGLATGFLIAALHTAGIATLTHTPSPMKFLNRILQRPDNERPYLLLVGGFPADGCQVPAITRKPAHEVIVTL